MEILLNGNSLEIDGLDADVTILQLLESVEDSLKGTGATVVEIFLNEQAYSPDDIEKFGALKVVGFAKIELVAATAQEMIQAAFEDGDEGIAHLEDVAREVSSDLRIGKIKKAMDRYLELVDGVEWFVTMLKNADRAFAANMAESSLEADRQALMARLAEQMSGVRSAQESEDWVGMADILEYELPEIFNDGRGFIKQILES